jgi:hypothetical protein
MSGNVWTEEQSQCVHSILCSSQNTMICGIYVCSIRCILFSQILLRAFLTVPSIQLVTQKLRKLGWLSQYCNSTMGWAIVFPLESRHFSLLSMHTDCRPPPSLIPMVMRGGGHSPWNKAVVA